MCGYAYPRSQTRTVAGVMVAAILAGAAAFVAVSKLNAAASVAAKDNPTPWTVNVYNVDGTLRTNYWVARQPVLSSTHVRLVTTNGVTVNLLNQPVTVEGPR